MSQSKAPGASLITPWSLALTVPLWCIFLFMTCVTKVYQLIDLTDSFSLVRFVQVWAPDIAFSTIVTLFFALLLSQRSRWVTIPAMIVYYPFMFYLLGFTAAGHAYFLATGATMSWSSVEFWLTNFSDARQVMASEETQWRAILSYGQCVTVLVFALVPRIPPLKRWVLSRTTWSFRRGLVMSAAAAVAALVLALIPPASGPSMAISRSVAWDIMADFLQDVALPEDELVIAQSERLDASIEFKESARQRPNIVLIIFESLNWKSSDVHTPGLGTTPFLDSLSADSKVVDFQYTVVPHTTKALVPINCGIYPYLDTKAKETLPGVLPRRCIAHILGAQGYKTAFFQPAANFEKRDVLVSNMGYQTYRGLKDLPQEGFEQTNYFGKEERIMLLPSMDWVDSVGDQPFLLTYLTLSTHHNYITPQSFPYTHYPVEDVDQRNFFNAVRYTDEFIKEVFAEFQRRDMMNNTVFIIIGDHGEAFGEHNRRQHDLVMWEEGIRSFSMLYAPWLLPSGTVDGFRSHLDLVPTVVDLLGLELSKGDFVGSSLLKPAPEARSLYHSCWFKRRCLALREGPVKTIYHYGLRPMEVYNNSEDPLDLNNLAYSPGFGDPFLNDKEDKMIRWARVVNQQYEEWETALTQGLLTTKKPAVDNDLGARFGDMVELVGYDLKPELAGAGSDITVRYVFKGLEALSKHHRLFVHVAHRDGFINADHEPGRGAYPVHKWEPGHYIVDEHTIHIPGTWRSGEARLLIGFWDKKSGKRLEVSQTSAPIDKQRLEIARVAIQGSKTSSTMTLEQRRKKIARWIGEKPFPVGTTLAATFADKVQLVGANLTRMDVHLAGTVEMSYLFKALDDIPRSWKLVVSLVRDDGTIISGDHVPIGGLYPPGDWRAGEYILDLHRIHIDMHKCKPGSYKVYLGFKTHRTPVPVVTGLPTDSANRIHIGTVTITRGMEQ